MRPDVRGIGVVIPARDEESLIGGCLDAIHVAARVVDVPVRTVVVLDDCVDGTLGICDSFGVDTVPVVARNVGRARAAGIRHILAQEADPASVWLANTDADTRVSPDWLRSQIDMAREGADVVLGVVRLSDDDAAHRRGEYERQYAELMGRHSTHGHVHGANLGLRASTYLRAGGFPPLPNHEDRELVMRLRAMTDTTIVRCQHVYVVTSGRRQSRCDAGFAATLARLDTEEPVSIPA